MSAATSASHEAFFSAARTSSTRSDRPRKIERPHGDAGGARDVARARAAQAIVCQEPRSDLEQSLPRAREAMLALPRVESPLSEGVVLEAVALYRKARRSGRKLRSYVDCLVAACALRHDLEVLHRDRDYTALASVSPLREREV